MRATGFFLLLVLIIIGFAIAPGGRLARADEPITVSVTPAVNRGDARLTILVERDDENRALMWEVDGPNYYRSSAQQLDGAASPRAWSVLLHDIPAGVFAVRAMVKRSDRSESLATTEMRVVMGFD